MDDPLVRLGVVLGAALVVLLVGWLRRSRVQGRRIKSTDLQSGIYLFTSETCQDCAIARERLGTIEYVDVTWEEAPGEFERLGITEVPGTLIVSPSGVGTWYRGVPAKVVKLHNP